MLKKNHLADLVIITLCFAVVFASIFFPSYINTALRDALIYAVDVVLPSLFPFLIIAALLSDGHVATLLGAVFYPYVKFLLGLNNKKIGMVIVSTLLGGFAAGAVTLDKISTDGLSLCEISACVPLIFMPSVPFIVFVAGGAMLGSLTLGLYLAVSVMFATFMTAAVMRWTTARKVITKPKKESTQNGLLIKKTTPPTSKKVVSAVKISVDNMLYIIGFIVCFGVVSSLLVAVLPSEFALFCGAVFEFSTAVAAFAETGNVYSFAVALSLTVVCAYFQIEVITGGEIPLSSAVVSRILHLPLTLLALKILLGLFPQVVAVSSSPSPLVITTVLGIEPAIVALLVVLSFFVELVEVTKQ